MEILVSTSAFFVLLLVLGLLFVASTSLRSIVRQVMPAHEPKLLLPSDNWYMPQNALGNLRLVGLFRAQPDSLMSSAAFRVTLSQTRVLAATILLGWGALLAYAVAA